MPVTCPKCGRETERRETFCENCGAFLGWEEGESPDSQVFPQPVPQRGGDQLASVRVQVKDDLIAVAPGSAESTTFTLKNLGTQVEQFRCVVTGPEWLAVEPATMTVYPGAEATGTIQAAPPRKTGSLAGVTPFRLTVTSALHAHVSSSASGRVEVAPFYELAAELVPTSSHGRGLTQHRVTLDNRGNLPLRIALNPADVADGLRLGVPAFADVPPGRVLEVPVSVYASRRWIGRPEPRSFSIVAEPPKPLGPARLPGTRVVIPVFPRWVPIAAAGLVVAAVAAATVIPKLAAQTGPGPSQSPSSAVPSLQSSAPSSAPQSSAPPSTSQPASQASTSQPAAPPPTSQPAVQPPPAQPVPSVTRGSGTKDEALSFNGGNHVVTIPGSLPISTAFSVQATVTPAAAGPSNVYLGIVRAAREGGGGAWVMFVADGRWGLSVCTPSCNAASAPLAVGQKHVLSGTYDGHTIAIFQDGVQVGSAPLTGTVLSFSTLEIGRWSASFNGVIDDVAVWNAALSAGQVSSAAAHPPAGHQTGLVGLWRFDEVSGQQVLDSSGGGHNGFLGDSPTTDAADPARVPGTG